MSCRHHHRSPAIAGAAFSQESDYQKVEYGMKSCLAPKTGQKAGGAQAATAKRIILPACLAALTACTSVLSPFTSKPQPATPVVLPTRSTSPIVLLDERMNQGEAAVRAGDHAKAREIWQAIASDYPIAKAPWLKLSEDYFNAEDYGNAVLAAQEVIRRDALDRAAHSVLAMSGLRLTAASLTALHDDGVYPVGWRDEAASVTQALRNVLADTAPVHRHVLRPAARASSGSASNETIAATSAAVPRPAPTPAPHPSAQPVFTPTGNPLDKLR